MSNNNSKTSGASSGMGFLGGLALMFTWLKLNPSSNYDTPVEFWSWWLVLAPIWIPVAIVLGIFLVALISMIFLKVTDK